MARYILDPYAQTYDSLGTAMATLGKAMASGPSAAETDYYKARTGHTDLESEKLRRQFSGNDAVAGYAGNPNFDAGGYAKARADFIRGGGDVSKLGDLLRALAYTQQGTPQGARDSSFLAAGGSAANTETGHKATLDNAITRTGMQEGGAMARTQATIAGHRDLELEKDRRVLMPVLLPGADGAPSLTMRPKSLVGSPMFAGTPVLEKGYYSPSERPGGGFALQPNQPGLAVGGPFDKQKPDNYRLPTGETVLSRDGVTDLQGQPIGRGAQKFGVTLPETVGTAESKSLADKNTSLDLLRGTLADARSLATPDRMGGVGMTRRTLQDAINQGSAFAQWLGGDQNKVRETLAGIHPSLAENFDKGAEEFDTLANLLAYRAASALADQRGQGVSDKDVKRFRDMIGDSGILANPGAFNARTDALMREVERETSAIRAQGNRSGPRAGGAPPIGLTPQAPGAPAGGGVRPLRYNRDTGQLE